MSVTATLLPSAEELAVLVAELRSEPAVVRTELAEAKVRIVDLEARLGQNSTNSSRPPSSDGLMKPAPKSLREKSGRSPGRPKGRPGLTLRQVPGPDHGVEYRPQGPCAGCGSDLAEAAVAGTECRQVFDLPEEIRLEVTGHRLLSLRCFCGRKTRATAPEGVTAPVQYGPRLASAGVYLM
ncbi:DUF6444 domain-containing protein, partial [Streptomyces sp. NPDC057910]|uniref:DUF6444 domain-containing protein n=1 Tax=Streptomyces sp. NPDC057910 TaxID=3346278 RepID=UPI0036EA81B2